MRPQFTSVQGHQVSASQSDEVIKKTHHFDRWHQYFSKTRSYTAARFIFEMLLLTWFLKVVITLPISLTVLLVYGDPAVWQNPQQAAFAARPVANTLLALAVAPVVETMMGQWLPIVLARQFTSRPQPILVATTLFFAGLHLLSWDLMVAVAAIPVGFVLAWSFLVWSRQSLAHAMSVTAAIHAFHNAIALCLMAW
jgi:hypothetical protein